MGVGCGGVRGAGNGDKTSFGKLTGVCGDIDVTPCVGVAEGGGEVSEGNGSIWSNGEGVDVTMDPFDEFEEEDG